MSRRLTACLVTMFLLSISCRMVSAQNDFPPPPTPGQGGSDSGTIGGPMLPPPPPSGDSGDPGMTPSPYGNDADQLDNNGGFTANDNDDGSSAWSNPSSGRSGSGGSASTSRPVGASGASGAAGNNDEPFTTDLDPSPQLTIDPTVSTSSANWTMSGKNILHNCYVPESLTYPLKLQWKFVTRQTADYPTSPVVADGIMYFCTNSRLYAMNAETGSLYWKYPTDIPVAGRITQPPCIGDDLIYFGSGDGKLFAIKKKDGVLAWTFATKGAITTAPVLYENTLYIGSADHRLYTLDAQTGQQKWKGGFLTRDNIVGSPVIAGGLVYFLSNDMNLYSAVAETGQLKWWTRVGTSSKSSSPIIGDGLVYLSTGGMMQAFQAQTGYQKWAFTLPGNITSVPVYANGVLYFACSDHKLYAITREGRSKWKAPVDMKVTAFGTPVIAGDSIIIGGGKGTIMAVDTETGKVKWNYTTMPSYLDIGKYEYVNMTSPMVVYKDTLYSFSDDGTLFTFRSDVVDSTPPLVSTFLPTRDSLVPGTGTLTIGGIVSDEGSGINWDTASLSLDGKPVEFKTKPERGLIWFNHKVSDVGRIEPLADGRHNITMKLTDWSGNTSSTEWSFIVDNRISVSPEELNDMTNQGPNGNNRLGGAGRGGAPGAGRGGGGAGQLGGIFGR